MDLVIGMEFDQPGVKGHLQITQ